MLTPQESMIITLVIGTVTGILITLLIGIVTNTN